MEISGMEVEGDKVDAMAMSTLFTDPRAIATTVVAPRLG
jgi:hypothetical protein